MNKIKTIVENPMWSFIGTLFGILAFLGFRINMITHTVLQYTILAIALLLAIHGIYRLGRQKKNIKAKKEQLPQRQSEYTIMNDCTQDENAGWLKNPITDKIFCSKCWYENKTITPLIKDNEVSAGWICPRCKKTYTSLSRAFNNSFVVRYFIASFMLPLSLALKD